MEINLQMKQCTSCGTLGSGDFLTNVRIDELRGLCRNCQLIPEARWQIMRKWLRENPTANALQVSKATGLEYPEVLQYLGEGRLQHKLTAPDKN